MLEKGTKCIIAVLFAVVVVVVSVVVIIYIVLDMTANVSGRFSYEYYSC